MRRFAILLTFLTGFASSALALEKGLYAITEFEFTGTPAAIALARQAPLAGDLMTQLESVGEVAHGKFDPDTAELTTLSPDSTIIWRLDETAGVVFEGDRKVGEITEITDTRAIITYTDLPEFIPFGFRVTFTLSSEDDPLITASRNAIAQQKAREEEDRLAALSRLQVPPPEGLLFELPFSNLALALPADYEYTGIEAFNGGIIRYDFERAGAAAFDNILIFESPDQAGLDVIISYLDSDNAWRIPSNGDAIRFGEDAFGSVLLRAHREVDGRFFVAFAKGDAEAPVIEWHSIFTTLALVDDVDALTPAEIFNDPEALATFGLIPELDAASITACQNELPGLVEITEFTKQTSTRSSDVFATSSLANINCRIDLAESEDFIGLSVSITPEFAGFDSITLPEGSQVLRRDDTTYVFASDANLSRIKAMRLLDLDGVPLLVESSSTKLEGTLAFLEASATLDVSGLTFPENWRRHLGAFRSISKMRDAEHFYMFSLEGSAFEEGILTADGDIIVDAIYDNIRAFPGGFELEDTESNSGLIDAEGTLVLPLEYQTISIGDGSHPFILYRHDGKQQVYDFETRAFLGGVYDGVDYLENERLFVVEQNDLHQIMTLEMTPQVDDKFGYFLRIADGLFIVEEDEKAGLISMDGTEIIPMRYDRLWPHSKHRLISARIEKTSIYYTFDGTRIIPEGGRAHFAPSTEEGHVTFSDASGAFGVVSKTGEIVIEPNYAQMHQFNEGFIPAGLGPTRERRFGLIDENDTIILPFDYENLSLVRDGKLWARKDGNWGLLSIDGTQIVDFIYPAAHAMQPVKRHDTGEEEAVVIAKKDGFYGLLEHGTGAVILPFEYPQARARPFQMFKDGAWLNYPWDFKTD